MTAWAEIESANPSVASQSTTAGQSGVRQATRTVRLRRTPRLIVGSIDSAAHVFQRRARHVLLGSAIFMVPMVALYLVLTGLALDNYEQFDTLLGDRGYVGVETGFAMIALILESLTAHIIGAFTAAYLVPYQMGDDPRPLPCVRGVLRKLPLLTTAWALTHWPTLLILWWLATIAPAEVLGLSFVIGPILAALSAATLLVAPVVMSEGLRLRSISRAWRLARTRFTAVFGFVFACAVLALMLAAFIASLPALVEATGFITFGSLGWLVQGVMAQLAVLIVVPFVAIATAQLYLQLRVHAEGLDIVIAADRAFPARAMQ